MNKGDGLRSIDEPFHHEKILYPLDVNLSRARVIYQVCDFPKIEMSHGSGLKRWSAMRKSSDAGSYAG